VRIQKVNSQIGDSEKKINQSRAQIQQTMLKIGERAAEMLRAGTLASPEMQALLDQITGIEQQIAAEEAAIVEKRAEIEKIKAEANTEKSAGAATVEPPAPPLVPAAAAPAGRFCPQCGTPAGGSGAFCTQCGAKLA
jgi:hypothetical protein